MSLLKLAVFVGVMVATVAIAAVPEDYAARLADAIYLAEGGAKASRPYGIMAKRRLTEQEARRWCLNTIRSNWKRWEQAGKPGDFVDSLAQRYAPVGAANDPRGLNKNWPRNVKRLMERHNKQ